MEFPNNNSVSFVLLCLCARSLEIGFYRYKGLKIKYCCSGLRLAVCGIYIFFRGLNNNIFR